MITNITNEFCYIELYKSIDIICSNLYNNTDSLEYPNSKVIGLDKNFNYISTKMNAGVQEIRLKSNHVDNGNILVFYDNSDYTIYKEDSSNINLYIKPGKEIKYLARAEEYYNSDLKVLDNKRFYMNIDTNYNVFRVQVNGVHITDFTYDSNTKIIEIGSKYNNVFRTFNNNIHVIAYDKVQTIYGQIIFEYDSFDSVYDGVQVNTGIFFDRDVFLHFNNFDNCSINMTGDFFEFINKGENVKQKYLVNKTNDITFTLYRDSNIKNIEEHVRGNKFRIIFFDDMLNEFSYYTNCKLRYEMQFDKSKTTNDTTITIEADDNFRVRGGSNGYNKGYYSSGLYGDSYTFEVI